MVKPLFLYATGTAFFANVFGTPFGPIGGPEQLLTRGARKFYFDGLITNDPFWRMLDEQIWDARKVDYAAAVWPMNSSLSAGRDLGRAHILSVPAGTPIVLGGYSQGAALMSLLKRDMESGGALESRAADFKGAVLFGNPMRQQDFLAPGLTYSGSWDVPGSTSGSSGCFPDRLTDCEFGVWREYVLPNDIITATGTSVVGAGWRAAVGWLTGLSDPLTALAGLLNTDWLAGISAALGIGAGAHGAYPVQPPPDVTVEGCYALAHDYLDELAAELYIEPILAPNDPLVARPWTTVRPTPLAV